MNPADLIECYDHGCKDVAESTADEWRTSARVARVRLVRRTVRAFGATTDVWVVCVWYTEQSKVRGWNG